MEKEIKYSDFFDTSEEAQDDETINVIFVKYFINWMKSNKIKEKLKLLYKNVEYIDKKSEGWPEQNGENVANYYIKNLVDKDGFNNLVSKIEERKNKILNLEKVIQNGVEEEKKYTIRKLFPFIITCFDITKEKKIINAFSPNGNFLIDSIEKIHEKIIDNDIYYVNLYFLFDAKPLEGLSYIPNNDVLVIFNHKLLRSNWFFDERKTKGKKSNFYSTFKYYKVTTQIKKEFVLPRPRSKFLIKSF